MKCPSCGAANLVHDTQDLPYAYKGETTTLPHVTGDFCPACNESLLGPEDTQRAMALMLEFNKRVNTSFADPNLLDAERAA